MMKRWKMDKHMPMIAMIFTQFIYAAMFLLSKAAISSGMKPSIFIAYRQALAALALAPFAYYAARTKPLRLSFYLLLKIFIVCSCGMTVSLNLYYAAFNYISATFATAVTNTIPAMVFIIAVSLRIEEVGISEKQGWAKILGTVVGICGAMVFTFYKGPHVYNGLAHKGIAKNYSKAEWIKGSLLLLGANLAWCIWLVMQAPILKEYPAKVRLTTIQCGLSCLVSVVYGAVKERDISSWKLGWDVNLLSVAYCGIVASAMNFSMQVWVVEKKGPVFISIFSPLALILTALFSALIFHESLYCGSVVGGAILVIGLYAFLWGKNRETQLGAQQHMNPSRKEEAHLESIIASKPADDEKTNKARIFDNSPQKVLRATNPVLGGKA